MKLIIDIPEEVKKVFDNATKEDIYGCFYDHNSVIGNAIKNGTPLKKELKKIRTKIDALPTMSCNSIGCSYMWAKDYKIDVLSILDKSIEENK